MKKRRRPYRPQLDALEDRVVLSTYGNPWPDPGEISISFAPDGTKDGLQSSSLSQTLNGLNANGGDWELTMLRAFQTWATEANVNFTVTSDNGAAFGVTGAIQDDSRFGDIRVGAIPQTPVTLALTQPFSYGAGTWSGDVNLNSTDTFGINNPNAVDLFTVALHEAGHSLGLDVNNDPNSVMYTYYSGSHPTLSASDIAAVQAIYGSATDTPNNSFATASKIQPVAFFGLNAPMANVTVQNRLATPTSKDVYVLNDPFNPGPLHVQLKTSGLSLLEATVTVYDANHNVVASSTATDPRSGDLSVAMSGLTPNSNYYIAIQGAHGDAFSVGAYQVRVLPDSITWTLSAPEAVNKITNGLVNSTVNNLSAATALPLSTWAGVNGPQDYFYQGSLSAPEQSRYYSLATPESIPSGSQDVMSVSVWGTDTHPLDTVATVYDSKMNPVSATVIEHENGSYVIQIPNAAVDSLYLVKISPYDSSVPSMPGNFDLSVDFASTVEGQSLINKGNLSGSSTPVSSTISLPHDTLYNFILGASNSGNASGNSVVLTLTAANGTVVDTLVSKANQAQSLQIWLTAGTYNLSITGLTPSSPLKWTLYGEDLSSPIKVYGNGGGGSSGPR